MEKATRYRLAGLAALATALTASLAAQEAQPPWWAGMDLGYGRLRFSSAPSRGSFALGLMGGHSLGNRARVGLELNGWLQQSYNLNDPTVGESVSNVLGVLDVFPVAHVAAFVRAGAGAAMYTNNRPGESGGSGWSWTAGIGYEIRISKLLALAPVIDYAGGRLGNLPTGATAETGRRYSVVEGKLGAVCRFGRR